MNTPLHSLEQQVSDFIQFHRLVSPGEHILVAVSGGVDSMAMLHLFERLRTSLKVTITACHVNHQLRGQESDGDEEFVRSACSALKIPCLVEKVDTLRFKADSRRSTQEAARDLRYETLENMKKTSGAHSVATAHHSDDNAETVLLNLLRGTGVRGLAGIPLQRDPGIIRPLLFARRSQIEQYVRDRNIRFREDSTNSSDSYTRNTIRHTLIPLLARENGDIVPSIARIADHMREYVKAIDQKVDATIDVVVSREEGSGTIVHLREFLKLPPVLRDEIFLRVLRSHNIELSAAKMSQLYSLCTKQTGRHIQLSDSFAAVRERDQLIVGPTSYAAPPFEFAVEVGRRYTNFGFSFSAIETGNRPVDFSHDTNTELVDAACLQKPLVLRSWKAGDRFIPLGMSQSKKVSDFFADRKVPRTRKCQIPILESHGSIVWICGHRLDDRFKVTPSSVKIVQLTYSPHTRAVS